MSPLVTLITSNKHSPDFGDMTEPYGDLDSYQTSGLSLTLINIPSWSMVDEFIASSNATAPLTASISPCKTQPSFLIHLTPPRLPRLTLLP